MIVYDKPPHFASNFYQQVSFLVADAFLSISGNAFRFNAKCVVSLEIDTHLLVYSLAAEELTFLHLFIYIYIKYFLCCSMALLESNGIAIDVK